MAVITRPELIKMVSKKIYGRYSKEEIYWIVKGVFQCFEDILRNGDTLNITDCFTMMPVLKKERTIENYFGKGKHTVQAHYVPMIKPHNKLKKVCLELPVEEEISDEKENESEE